MRFLIDGHNVIAQLPDIDLEAPDDEAQLVIKLRSFCARTGKKVTVVFDGGIPGGESKPLSTSQVRVRFASAEQSTADFVLQKMLKKIVNTQAYTLVTSDRELLDTARQHRIATMTTPEFIQTLHEERYPTEPDDDKDDDPLITPQEVEEWLRIFGGES